MNDNNIDDELEQILDLLKRGHNRDTIKDLEIAKQDIKALITKQSVEARIIESELYKEWFNNDNNTHIEDFIDRRTQ